MAAKENRYAGPGPRSLSATLSWRILCEPKLAHIGEAQHRVGDIVLGGQFQRIHPRRLEGGEQFFLPRLGGGGEAGAETLVMGIDKKLVAAFGILKSEQ